MEITTQRIYDETDEAGARVLVDRLWPRGISKEEANLDAWIKAVAPSEELRTWYDHDPDRWEEFRRRYRAELRDNDGTIEGLLGVPDGDRLTLLYAASDREHNNAVVLHDFLEDRLD